jgi:hypothetical protein
VRPYVRKVRTAYEDNVPNKIKLMKKPLDKYAIESIMLDSIVRRPGAGGVGEGTPLIWSERLQPAGQVVMLLGAGIEISEETFESVLS